jgi:hypothetical protein
VNNRDAEPAAGESRESDTMMVLPSASNQPTARSTLELSVGKMRRVVDRRAKH